MWMAGLTESRVLFLNRGDETTASAYAGYRNWAVPVSFLLILCMSLKGSLISDHLTMKDCFRRSIPASLTYPAPLVIFLFRSRSFLATRSSGFNR